VNAPPPGAGRTTQAATDERLLSLRCRRELDVTAQRFEPRLITSSLSMP
jgi:hypothetical protein